MKRYITLALMLCAASAQAATDTVYVIQRSDSAAVAQSNKQTGLAFQRLAATLDASRTMSARSIERAQSRADDAMTVYIVVSIVGALALLLVAAK
jgi:hypothetical protein